MIAPGVSFQALRDELRDVLQKELRAEVRAALSEVLEGHLSGSERHMEGVQAESLSRDVQQLSARLHRSIRQEIIRFRRGLATTPDTSGSDPCDAVPIIDSVPAQNRLRAVTPLTSRTPQDRRRPITPKLVPTFVQYSKGKRRTATLTTRSTSGGAWDEPPLIPTTAPNDLVRSTDAVASKESCKGSIIPPHCVAGILLSGSAPLAQERLAIVDIGSSGDDVIDMSSGEVLGRTAAKHKSPVGFFETSGDVSLVSKANDTSLSRLRPAPLSIDALDAQVVPDIHSPDSPTVVDLPTAPDCAKFKMMPTARFPAGRIVVQSVNERLTCISSAASSMFQQDDDVASKRRMRMSMVGLQKEDLGRTRWGKQVLLDTLAAHSIAHAVITRIVVSNIFDYVMCVVLAVNAVVIGAQVEHSAQHTSSDTPGYFRTCEQLFCITFTLELSARIYVFRERFIHGPDWSWNLFDSLAVALALLEEIMVAASGGMTSEQTGEVSRNVKQVKMLRFLRLLRALRVLRIVRFVQELSNIIYLIVGSLWSFVWTFALLMLLTYISATFVTQIVADHRISLTEEDSDESVPESMTRFWGDIGKSVFSLFQGITGGVDWREVVEPLRSVNPVLPWMFALYIAFAALVMLNLVTGVFVESAQSLSQQDKKLELIRKLRMVLDLAGIREGGFITWEEFEEQLGNAELAAFFEAINIDRTEAETVFQLLDSGGEGSITAEDFVHGGLRLQGPAKAIDLARTQLSVDLAREQLAQVEAAILDLKDPLKAGKGSTSSDASVHRRSRPCPRRTFGPMRPNGCSLHLPAFMRPQMPGTDDST